MMHKVISKKFAFITLKLMTLVLHPTFFFFFCKIESNSTALNLKTWSWKWEIGNKVFELLLHL